MAITIEDIRNKDFESERSGYSCDQVDDFLDELADQMKEMATDHARLEGDLKKANAVIAKLREELENARAQAADAAQEAEKAREEAANVPAVQPAPTFNEPSYFKNLETTLRETLISAQRIADETIDEANKQAAKIVADAQGEADRIQADSEQRQAKAQADFDEIKAAGKDYFAALRALLDEQNNVLNGCAIAKEN